MPGKLLKILVGCIDGELVSGRYSTDQEIGVGALDSLGTAEVENFAAVT